MHAQWRQRLVAAVAVLVVTASGVFAPALVTWFLVLTVLVGVALYETVKLNETATADV